MGSVTGQGTVAFCLSRGVVTGWRRLDRPEFNLMDRLLVAGKLTSPSSYCFLNCGFCPVIGLCSPFSGGNLKFTKKKKKRNRPEIFT